jgi:MFS family permease
MTNLQRLVDNDRQSMRTVGVATLVGTALEAYDFVLYAYAAALVFGEVFFPRLSPASGTLAAIASTGVAFIARPLGAVLFGHFGDRIGRKPMLIVALVLSGAATFAMGLLPGYASIGLAAPAILVVLRFLQGIGLGGELSGAVLLAAEHAPAGRRGGYASLPQVGANLGTLLASATLLTLSATLSDEAFRAWGWRIPFLAGGALMAVGLYVRLAVAESPVFTKDLAGAAPAATKSRERGPERGPERGRGRAAARAARLPVWDTVRRMPQTLLLGIGTLTVAYMIPYTVHSFAQAYGVGIGIPRTTLLSSSLIAAVIGAAAVGLFAVLSDRVGRRPVCIAGGVAAIAWAYPFLGLIHTRSQLWITVSFAVALVIVGMIGGPTAAYLPELFESRLRYSGVALITNVAAILGGGLSPIIGTALLNATDSAWWVTGYLALTALISVACSVALPETYARDLAQPSRVRSHA